MSRVGSGNVNNNKFKADLYNSSTGVNPIKGDW